MNKCGKCGKNFMSPAQLAHHEANADRLDQSTQRVEQIAANMPTIEERAAEQYKHWRS